MVKFIGISLINSFDLFSIGVVNSISQACGKLSFNIGNYLHTQKEGILMFLIK